MESAIVSTLKCDTNSNRDLSIALSFMVKSPPILPGLWLIPQRLNPRPALCDLASGAKQEKYYALAHFSRWIQRDDIRIKAASSSGDVEAVAFKRSNGGGDDHRYSVDLINKSAYMQKLWSTRKISITSL